MVLPSPHVTFCYSPRPPSPILLILRSDQGIELHCGDAAPLFGLVGHLPVSRPPRGILFDLQLSADDATSLFDPPLFHISSNRSFQAGKNDLHLASSLHIV